MSNNHVRINSVNNHSHFKESDLQESIHENYGEQINSNTLQQDYRSQSVEFSNNGSPIKGVSKRRVTNTNKPSALSSFTGNRHFSRNAIDKYESLIVRTQSRTGTLDNEEHLLVQEVKDEEEEQVAVEKASFKWILKSCIEEALSFALEWAPSTIILYFISKNNSQDTVSGFGLGAVWSNCIGQGLYYGLGSGLETMASHAHGAKNYKLVGLLFQKALFISMIMYIPITLAMIFSESILGLWNDDSSFCSIASTYCQLSIPGIFLAGLYYCLKASLNAQNEYRIQVYTASINLATIVLYCFLFIQYLDLGVKGAAIVFTLSEVTCLSLLSFFAYRKKELRRCFIPFTKECLKDIIPFLKVAVPIGSIVAAEWIIFELNSIISSNLSSAQYSAYLVLSNFSAMCFQFQIGYSTAASTFISNEMGQKNIKNALQYTKYSVYIILGHVAIVILPLVFLRKQIAGLFTVEQDVEDALLSAYFIFLLTFTIESFQSILTAYMRAIAQEKYCSITFFLSYGAIGLISSYLFAYQAKLGIQGIWYGMLVGIGFYIVLQIVQILRVNIHDMAAIIAKRVQEEEEQENEDNIDQIEQDNNTQLPQQDDDDQSS